VGNAAASYQQATRRSVANLNDFAKMYLLPAYLADWILPSTYHVSRNPVVRIRGSGSKRHGTGTLFKTTKS
jgi:hypothetical protein